MVEEQPSTSLRLVFKTVAGCRNLELIKVVVAISQQQVLMRSAAAFSMAHRAGQVSLVSGLGPLYGVPPISCRNDGEYFIVYKNDFKGNSSQAGNFIEGRQVYTAGLKGKYHNSVGGELAYSKFWGGGQQNPLRDRDNVVMSVSYTF